MNNELILLAEEKLIEDYFDERDPFVNEDLFSLRRTIVRKRKPVKEFLGRKTRLKGHEDTSLIEKKISELEIFINNIKLVLSLDNTPKRYKKAFVDIVNREKKFIYQEIKREITGVSRRTLINKLNNLSL